MLSTFVRADSARAPLAFLAGMPYFIICNVWLLWAMWLGMPRYGWAGWALHVLVSTFLFAVDGWSTNWFGKNIVSLRANGFGDMQSAATIVFNLAYSQAMTLVIFHTHGISDPVELVFSAPSSSGGVWLARATKIGINLALTEVAFFLAHRALHLSPLLSPLHKMHHCCRWASNTTNALFHPLDLALEFAGPYMCVVGMHACAWADTSVLFVSLFIVQFWYAFDHSDMLRLAHYAHHTSINRNYAIYSRWSDASAAPDLVKQNLTFI